MIVAILLVMHVNAQFCVCEKQTGEKNSNEKLNRACSTSL